MEYRIFGSLTKVFVFFFVFFGATIGQAQTVVPVTTYVSTIEIKCGTGIYICISDDELRSLAGKTLKYRHPRGDMGDVKLRLKNDGSVQATNAKDNSDGTWEVKDSKIIFKFNKFPGMTTTLVRIQNYLFVQYSGTGTIALVPVEVVTE